MNKSSKGFIVPLLLVVLAALVVGGGVYLFTQKKVEAPSTAPTPTPMPTVIVTTTPSYKAVTSPKAGDQYVLGTRLYITWDPTAIDMSTIELHSLEDPQYSGGQIYRRETLGDTVSIKGEYVYPLPKMFEEYPGTYTVKILNYGGTKILESDKFTIVSPQPMVKRMSEMFTIKNVYGAKDSYKTGESLVVNVEGADGDGKEVSWDRGFNIQARLFNQNNVSIDAVNGVYEPNAQTWNVTFPPFEATSTAYRVEIGLYCGSIALDSLCAQEHGVGNHVTRFVTFKLN